MADFPFSTPERSQRRTGLKNVSPNGLHYSWDWAGVHFIALGIVVGEVRDGHCHFRCDADSPLVRGLLVLLGDFYSGGTPVEVAATEPALIEQLGLDRSLSPTRLNGLRSVRAKIRDFAAAQFP